MLDRGRAIGPLKVGDSVAPEDVETTLYVFQLLEDGMETIAENV